MFHLLVSYSGWPEGAGTISNSRIYLNEKEVPGNTFIKDGRLDLAEISKIPALLVTETGGNGPQFARVAHITGIVQGPKETSIQYAVDTGIRPISNEDLERYSTQMGLGRFALTHTHWALNQADLFRILLMNQEKNQISPTAFKIDAINRQQPDLVSVMMPFSAEFDAVYAALQSAVTSAGLKALRADDFWEHQFVIQDIVELIAKARVVICDCSGRNPNVFYEAGIAHTLGKEVILIAQTEADVPFDLRHIRYVTYLNNSEGLADLSRAVQSRIRTIVGLR